MLLQQAASEAHASHPAEPPTSNKTGQEPDRSVTPPVSAPLRSQVPGRRPRQQQGGGHQCQHPECRAVKPLQLRGWQLLGRPATRPQPPSQSACQPSSQSCCQPAATQHEACEARAPHAMPGRQHRLLANCSSQRWPADGRARLGCQSRGVLALPLWPPAPACCVCAPASLSYCLLNRACKWRRLVPITPFPSFPPATDSGARHSEPGL